MQHLPPFPGQQSLRGGFFLLIHLKFAHASSYLLIFPGLLTALLLLVRQEGAVGTVCSVPTSALSLGDEPRSGKRLWDPRYSVGESSTAWSKCFFSACIIFMLLVGRECYFRMLHQMPVTQVRGKGGQSWSEISSPGHTHGGPASSASLSQTRSDPAVTHRFDGAWQKHGEPPKTRGLPRTSCGEQLMVPAFNLAGPFSPFQHEHFFFCRS